MQTIKLIGTTIQDGSRDLRIRHLAGRIAATAPPKDYNAQIQAIYNAITRDLWRYTFDATGTEMLTVDPERIFTVTLGAGWSNHRGYGDCDDIATAGGALLNAIGMRTIIATTAKPGSANIFDHVFLFVRPPHARKWICFDPVLYPYQHFGACTNYNRMALWSLDGKLLKKIGPFPLRFDAVMRSFGYCQPYGALTNLTGTIKGEQMPNYNDFYDYSDQVLGFGEVPINPRTGRYPVDAVPDFRRFGIAGFGCYVGDMGYTRGDQVPHIMAEVDESDLLGSTGLVRTKHFELDPDDYAYMVQNGVPRIGAMALADDGEIYAWQPGYDGLGGLFKKLARRVKKRVKKIGRRVKSVAKRVGRGVKKFAKRIGRTKVFRLGKRILKTAMKYVKPFLKKYGGKIMKAVAPIAAAIPGAGPFISTALVVAGTAYDKAQQMGILFDKDKNPIFKSAAQATGFKDMLKREARKLGKKGAKAILKKYEKARGLAGASDLLMTEGSRFRTVNAPGFGWA
jgi:hypothetical protein